MTIRMMLSAMVAAAFCAGCVSSGSPSYTSAPAGTVERAEEMVRKISDKNLMPAVYRECELESSGITGEMVDGQPFVTARVTNKCKGVTYRKDGVNRPTPASDATQK
jgi:hypothetical protein